MKSKTVARTYSTLHACVSACHQKDTTAGDLFTDTGINEWDGDEWQQWKSQWDEKHDPVQETIKRTDSSMSQDSQQTKEQLIGET